MWCYFGYVWLGLHNRISVPWDSGISWEFIDLCALNSFHEYWLGIFLGFSYKCHSGVTMVYDHFVLWLVIHLDILGLYGGLIL